MRTNRIAVAVCLFICLVIPVATVRAAMQDGWLSHLGTAVTSVLTLVDNWNKAIDKITDTEIRKQLQRRMYRLHREMQDLERRKQDLLESILAEHFVNENVKTDIDQLQVSVSEIRKSLDAIGGRLGTEQSFDGKKFEDLMNYDLNEKSYILIQAKREQNRAALIDQLKAAITKIKEARMAVGECLKNLEKDL